MSRRSSRLVSGGYYNSDEESDSSSVTNISYRENPVKVFKKKAGARKPGSRTPSRAKSNASAAGPESDVTKGHYEGLSTSSPSSSETQPTMRTVPYVSPIATPRPALTPISARGQTPTRCPSAPPEKSPYTGLCGSGRPGLHLRPHHEQPSQSGVDSSGYSSSEGNQRVPPAAATSRIHGGGPGAPSAGYTAVISSAFSSLMDTISLKAAAAKCKVMHVAALANNSVSGHMKKAVGLLLLLLLLLLCLWFLLPWLTSLVSRVTVTKTPSQTNPKSQSVVSSTPAPRPVAVPPPPVVDPAVVSALVDARLQRFTDEMELKQEHLLSERRDRLQLDMQDLKAKLQALASDMSLHLDQEVAGLSKQMADHQTDSLAAVASLNLKIQALEAQNARLSQELSSVQLLPPPAPCPDPSTVPVLNHLTPELQQAMEKWLADRIEEQDLLRLRDKGGSWDCGRPMADKMADFALETQGASVISTRCSETYRIRSACVTLFGFPLWYPSESPRTVIQGYPVLLPGKCWAFHGVQGTLVISLSHPITITHVTVDHLPRYNSPTGHIDSAPKDFEVYGMRNDTEEGKLLGTFTYDADGESTQTFKFPSPGDEVYRVVELRVLSNWGHVEYTCLYRFRVHGQIAAT